MILKTTSEVISLSKELETKSANFYKTLARAFPEQAEMFQSLARENRKNIIQVERAYYGVITDAIEGCFAFSLEADDYQFSSTLPQKATFKETLAQVLKMEEMIKQFYTASAEQSKALMADVPRTFALIARKRNERIALVQTHLNSGSV